MLEIGSTTQACCQGISRRSFLQVGFISALGLTLPDFLRMKAEGAVKSDKQRAIILVWLWGGPAQLDMWDMKPDAPIEYRGPFSPIKTNVPGIEICELFPHLAQQADKDAIIRSLHHNENDHGIAGCIGLTGKPPVGSRALPHPGAIVSCVKETSTSLIPFRVIGSRLQQGHRLILGEGGGTRPLAQLLRCPHRGGRHQRRSSHRRVRQARCRTRRTPRHSRRYFRHRFGARRHRHNGTHHHRTHTGRRGNSGVDLIHKSTRILAHSIRRISFV